MSSTSPARVRFAPSPTGYLHIGGARTALFNWLIARQTGGTFILRIEDTDTARNVDGADQKIMEDLRWLGLQWDEGVGVGGPNGPYYQSQRLEYHRSVVNRLLESGNAYYAFDTAEELEAMRAEAEAKKQAFMYPRPATFPDESDVRKARQTGRPVVVRFKAPGQDVTVHDEVMGDVTVSARELDDFIILKADGMPTYHLANVADDAAMGVNFVLRGQEFLSQTPRHIALQRALGFTTPRYAHLPLIMDMQGRKLSKRDGAVEVFAFRQAGYLPEVLVNFIALLGWSPGRDREKMTLQEMIELFSIDRIGRTNARFDRDKLIAFNTDAGASASEERLAVAFDDYLAVNPDLRISRAKLDEATRRSLLRINKGFRTFADIEYKCGFIYDADENIAYDPDAIKKVLTKGDNAGYRMLESLVPRLESVDPWTAENVESLLKQICQEQSVNMGKVAQPIRVAVSGSTISPPIGETLALLGKEKSLKRVRQCLAGRA
ncbi:MAG TPA: glutamate--tRNA ligase [Phycisphaerae bacterium]|nr:glutamate--tRNA ligase [Phycisphaerae bacterium]HRR87084.1 glutamate--tRNA ligase [Phycisphaerae bacterium]